MRDTSIKVDWPEIISSLHIGAVPIVSYSLEWNQGIDSWVSLIGDPSDSLALSFTVTNSVVAGNKYSFRLRAKNLHGWGPYSELMQAIPSWIPSQMTAASLTIENIYVKIAWSEP
jgi:hypothetical protein